MPSVYHDREWQRNSVCQDPHTSLGLPPLAWKGELEGFWRGKFLFYEFETYRQMLAGNIRAVYTSQFAEQVVEMELKETVIHCKKDERGGKGPMVCAGFDEVEDYESETKKIEAGYGFEIFEGDENDNEEMTEEIMITGRSRTSWGWANVRGRVRAWDSLLSKQKIGMKLIFSPCPWAVGSGEVIYTREDTLLVAGETPSLPSIFEDTKARSLWFEQETSSIHLISPRGWRIVLEWLRMK